MHDHVLLNKDLLPDLTCRPSKRQKTPVDDELPTLQYHDYTVAWICALHIEMAAALAMLDENHQPLPVYSGDSNAYALGRIEQHNVVIACLPAAQYGTNNAANVATNLKRTFPAIRAGLMVGIGGGVPSKADIRLGDIVVGTRVMQFDLGKMVGDGEISPTAFPRFPDMLLSTAVSSLRAKHELESSRVASILEQKLAGRPEFGRPTTPDRLFQAAYVHEPGNDNCEECDSWGLIQRSTRMSTSVAIHYGAVASGNQVMRSASMRDKLGHNLDVICFEMEAAGLMETLHCLPIRGICDYADSHKSKEWQRYAAAAAAAYAAELVGELHALTGQVRPAHLQNPTHEQSSLSNERRDELLKSLRFDRIEFRKSNIVAAYARTCEWFLTHDIYHSWIDPAKLKEHHGFLWVRGKPGAGKSTIMKFAYLKMSGKARSKNHRTASFFFNARGEALEKSIIGMYRSLLYQILKGFPDLHPVLEDLDIILEGQNDCPSLNALKDLFRDAVGGLRGRSFTCFIDALDECDEQQVVDMIQYFEELAEECAAKSVQFRVCFSSRHYPYIHIKRGLRFTLESQTGHSKDMETFVKSRLRISDPTILEELRPQILEKAAGVFMWVVLVVDILNKEDRRGGLAMRKRFAELPANLSELFRDILRRDTDNMEHLQLCLLWILYAKRPLSPREFYHALWSGLSVKGLADSNIPDAREPDTGQAIDRFTRHVISSSKGLAEVTKSNQPVVQFMHESVRDYLIKDGGLLDLWPEFGKDFEAYGHDVLKECCSVYMNFDSVRATIQSFSTQEPLTKIDVMVKYPFLEYATEYLLHHADAASHAIPQDDFLFLFFVADWVRARNFFQKHRIREYDSNATLFYILADNGHPNLIRTRLKVDSNPGGSLGDRYRYPLFAALAGCHRDAVAALLNRDSYVVNGVDITEGIRHRKDLQCYWTGTPLSWAAQEGRLEMVKELLKTVKDVDLKDENGRTPLSLSVGKGQVAMSNYLIGEGADVCASDKNGWTPLHHAASSENDAVVQLLIRSGTDVNSRALSQETPLFQACEKGHTSTVRVLILEGAAIGVLNEKEQTPLHYAAKGGNALRFSGLAKVATKV
ncbi:uncharacterized protein BDV14DRAFT_206112 [Aspergillus stella-maris]|uniref:uncharacterized protein n=1 Tax=Aspergillus stella-maris TaxID=1810926 RepID=UPI003CCD284A